MKSLETAYKKMPYEAQQQVDNRLGDLDKDLKDVDIDFLVQEVKWTIERMIMEMQEYGPSHSLYKEAAANKKECETWLRNYDK